jgi:hypothetical protein
MDATSFAKWIQENASAIGSSVGAGRPGGEDDDDDDDDDSLSVASGDLSDFSELSD